MFLRFLFRRVSRRWWLWGGDLQDGALIPVLARVLLFAEILQLLEPVGGYVYVSPPCP